MSEVTTKTKHAVKQTFKHVEICVIYSWVHQKKGEKKKLFNVKKVPVSVLESV